MYVAFSFVRLTGFTNTLLMSMEMERATRPEGMIPHTSSPICKVCSFVSGSAVTFPLTNTHPFGLDKSTTDYEMGLQNFAGADTVFLMKG